MERQLDEMINSSNEEELLTQMLIFYNKYKIDNKILVLICNNYTYDSSTEAKTKYTKLSIIFELTYLYVTKNKCDIDFIAFFYHFVFCEVNKYIDECSASKLYKVLAKLTKTNVTEFSNEILKFCNTHSKTKYCKCYIQKIIDNIDTEHLMKNVAMYDSIKMYIYCTLYRKNGYVNKNIIVKILNEINTVLFDTETCQLLGLYDATTYISYFPVIFTKIGHRNLTKMFNVLSPIQKDILMQSKNITIHFYLNKNSTFDFSTFFCELLRIKYLEKINNLDALHDFVAKNQFIDDVGIRSEYIKIVKDKLQRLSDKTSPYYTKLYNLFVEMCESDVKIRREVGVNCVTLFCNSNGDIMLPTKLIHKLMYDPYEEVRDSIINYIKPNEFDEDTMLQNLLQYDYYKIYPTIHMIGNNYNHFTHHFLKIFELYKNDEKDKICKNPIYGFLILINSKKLNFDSQIQTLYEICMKKLKEVYNNEKTINKYKTEETTNQKLYEIIFWRTMKEIGVYYCNKITKMDDVDKLIYIMFNINHLGIYTHLYAQLCVKFESFTANIEKILNKIVFCLNEIEKNEFELSRKGAGISLLLVSFTYMKTCKNQIFMFLISEIMARCEYTKRKDVKVIYVNTIIKLVANTYLKDIAADYIVKLTHFAFKLAENNEWELKNVAHILFAAIITNVFGKNAWNRKIKKHVTNYAFRQLMLEELRKKRNKSIQYMILLVYDRCSELQTEEILEIEKFAKTKTLHKIKACKILYEKTKKPEKHVNIQQDETEILKDEIANDNDNMNIECDIRRCLNLTNNIDMLNTDKYTKHTQKEDYELQNKYDHATKMIKLYALLNDEDKRNRQNAVFYCHCLGFDLVSDEYMKVLIIKDAYHKKYIESLRKSLVKPQKLASHISCFEEESTNSYFDYQYNINLMNDCIQKNNEQ